MNQNSFILFEEQDMFWKKDKINVSSLTTRLIALYSLSTIGIMLAAGLFLYPTINRLLLHANETTNLTAECFTNAIVALLLSALSSILFGYLITTRNLKKIKDFSSKMRFITANSLHERINVNHWPVELKTVGNEFNTMLDRLEKSFMQLSQYSADISHELRNPLHHLRTSTEIALTKSQTVDDYQQLLASHLEEYECLSRLTENLLFLAKADHKQLQLDYATFSASAEVAKVCDYFKPILTEKNIGLTYQGDGQIRADKALFKRVMVNLLSNSIKYIPDKGLITIRIMENHAEGTLINVEDTGIGISPEHIDKVFDRFYRVDTSRSVQSGGLGLGLAIVKSILHLHNGKVSIKSQPNLGTCVAIQLPRCH